MGEKQGPEPHKVLACTEAKGKPSLIKKDLFVKKFHKMAKN